MSAGGDISIQDEITAYQLMIDHLPREQDFAGAIDDRGDGSSARGVFGVVEKVKREFYGRVGDLRAQAESGDAKE